MDEAPELAPTGIQGLDDVLAGGLPRNRLYLVQGKPGTGKTTLALQFLLNGVHHGEKGLYITLSETRDELLAVARSHGWSLDGLVILELSAIERQLAAEAKNSLFHPSEVELTKTTQLLMDEIARVQPARIVFDSLSELRLLAQSPLRHRRQMLEFKQILSSRQCTVLLLDDKTADVADLQVQSIAHGVIDLYQLAPEFGAERRRLTVSKLRGVWFRGGYHDYIIRPGGLTVFPRLVAAEHPTEFPHEMIASGIAPIDALLGGGLDRGTSNLFLGPAGSGKSTLAIQYAIAAAERGERVVHYSFEENLGTLIRRSEGIGLPLLKHIASGALAIHHIDPAELSPGELSFRIRRAVEKDNIRLLTIDSLNGYLNALLQENFLALQLHELLTYLSQKGVVSILVMAQHGLMGRMESVADISYLADTVVALRFFEASGEVKKAISVIKKRSGAHEPTIRELQINRNGIHVGPPLREFQGVLTGTPTYHGSASAMMRATPGAASNNA